MQCSRKKTVVIGAGNVGSAVAYSLVNQCICDEVVLIDMAAEKALGEVLDLKHCTYFMGRNIAVNAGDYRDCADADLVIITAAVPMRKDVSDRLSMLKPNLAVMREIVSSIMESGFSGIILVISNPVDIMTYYAWKLSGLPKSQVMGTGTLIDTARLCHHLSALYDVDARDVSGYVMGEHGDSEFVAWSSVAIGGKSIDDVFADNIQRTQEALQLTSRGAEVKGTVKDELLRRTIQVAWEIFSYKGNTCYAIANSATAVAKAIFFNDRSIFPLSTCVDGYYGLGEVFLGVPAVVDRRGIREIIEIHLAEEEQEALQHSASVLTSFYAQLSTFD